MAFTQHTISGNIVNALGIPFGANSVQVTATPLTSTTARTDGNTARLGTAVVDVPLSGALSLTLVDGPWRIRVATTGQAYGQPAFPPITVETNISADTSWGTLIATATDIEVINDNLQRFNDVAAAVTGYDEENVIGSVTIAASGIKVLRLTGDTTATITGDNGKSVLLHALLNGHTLSVEGVTVDTDGPVTCYRIDEGWQVYPYGAAVDSGGGGTTPDPSDTTAPTAPTLTVNNSSQTQLVATFGGGTDAVGVTRYRTRIDAGSWTIANAAGLRTFTGLTAGSSHTIDAQAGDAAGNWSTSTSVTKSTATGGSPTWTDTAVWTFESPDGTALNGLAPSSGSGAMTTNGGNVQGGRARYVSNNFATTYALPARTGGVAFQVDTAVGAGAALGFFGVTTDSARSKVCGLYIDGNGAVEAFDQSGGTSTYTPVAGRPAVPSDATLRLEVTPGSGNDGATSKFYVDGVLQGTLVGTGWTWRGNGFIWNIFANSSDASYYDNLTFQGMTA